MDPALLVNYATKTVLSSGGIDPNVAVRLDGRVYRRIDATTRTERWAETENFMCSKEASNLVDKGLVVPFAQVACTFDGMRHYETATIPCVSTPNQWTGLQFTDILACIIRLNMELEWTKSRFRATDCHTNNATFLHTQAVYFDLGSFSHVNHDYVLDHIRLSLEQYGWDVGLCPLGASLSEVESNVVRYGYGRTVTEDDWDTYDTSELPQCAGDIGAGDPEVAQLAYWVRQCRPSSILDVGANKGRMARVFARNGTHVTTIDTSERAVDACYTTAERLSLPITCLYGKVQDMNLGQHCDMVVASSVTHHLIRSGVSFADQAKLWNDLARRFLLVEFISPDDPTLSGWAPINDYNQSAFLSSLESAWRIVTQAPNGKHRTWYFMARR